MRTYLSCEFAHEDALPPEFDTDVRMPATLVETLLDEYTDPGDSVIDVFAGFGTTLTVAESLGREPYGLEYDPERVAYVEERLDSPERVRQGDALDFDAGQFPRCDCCLTSPPFMEQTDDRNPFRNYSGESSYDAYLDDIETAFENLKQVLASGARVVVSVSNIEHQGRVTTLAWDIADRVSAVLDFDGERVVAWEGDDGNGSFGYGYDHSYCLVFTNPV